MPAASHDLFDDSTMTFGEHLEELRLHLFKAILGYVLCTLGTLYYGNDIVAVLRHPIDAALKKYGQKVAVQDDLQTRPASLWSWIKEQWGFEETPEETNPPAEPESPASPQGDEITVQIDAYELGRQLHAAAPQVYPEPPDALQKHPLSLVLRSPAFRTWQGTTEQMARPVTLNVQEAFMTYLKVSLISGFVLASPWVFYQIWMFVAVGLYKHERKFVYLFGAMSLVLFLAGVVFCYRWVFRYVLDFLLGFNLMMGLTPQIRLSEWVSFAVMLPLMFGISFQLPLVMRFLTAISIFNVEAYREKRRLAILVIAFLSMVLTPADPMSMLLMMFPLVLLYELGIVLCQFAPAQNPFDAEPV
jgi:sec-independent protein translocase protein TatC